MSRPAPAINVVALLAALALGCAGPQSESRAPVTQTPDAPFRAQPPQALQQPLHFEAPNPEQRTLPDGATVLIQENHQLPLVVVEVTIKSGVNGEPPGQAGISDMVAAMLQEGTQTRSAMEIAGQLEDQAALLSANSGLESIRIHLNCLAETLPQSLDILADVILHPAFRRDDFERVRGLHLSQLLAKKGIPAAVASDQMARLLYGAGHPWGQPAGGTPESIRKLTPKDLERWHQEFFRPDDALITVSGDVRPEAMMALLQTRFSGWRPAPIPHRRLPAFPPGNVPHVVLVDRPNATQSQVWMGRRLFAATDPDAVPMFVADGILGGMFSSRLNETLREAKGYSYGVHSHVTLGRTSGTFITSGAIHAEHTVDAAEEYLREFRDFPNEPPTAQEMADSKQTLIGMIPSILETNDSVATALGSLVIKGLPLDYYATLPDKIREVTPEDVQQMAQKYIAPNPWQLVVVGPQKLSEEGLQKLGLGTVEVVHDLGAPGAVSQRSP